MPGTLFFVISVYGQSTDSTSKGLIDFPLRFVTRIQGRTATLDKQLTRATGKWMQRIAKHEARLKKKLYRIDSAAATRLFSSTGDDYAELSNRLKSDTGGNPRPPSGEYLAHADSARVSLSFLQQQPQLLSSGNRYEQMRSLSGSIAQLQQLQAKMQDADEIQTYIQQRKAQIKQSIGQYLQSGSLAAEYRGLNEDLYYYTQQVQQYKDMLNDPDKMEKQALAILDKLPAFREFMKNNSQLSSLFGMPANLGTPQGLVGLQTRSQLQQMVQGQITAGGASGMASLQDNLQAAQSQLDQYKKKLSDLGAGGGNVDIPDFKPNDQKTRSFLKRLVLGTNLQTTQASNYFPATTDLGMSLGYKLNGNNTVGIGASYKMGWGRGFNHIALSSQGAGLRSFLDIRIKGSISATGGLEYNYATAFSSLQQIRHLDDWTRSGLIGLSKTVSMKTRVFKNTNIQLLWDFLSYQQVPKTQPILVRVGYTWN